MRTLSLDEASSFLRLSPHEIITQVELGRLPGAKFNNELIFIDLDLAHFVRRHYCSANEITKTSISNNLSPPESGNHSILFKELVPHMLRLEENRQRRNELTAKTLRITHKRLDK